MTVESHYAAIAIDTLIAIIMIIIIIIIITTIIINIYKAPIADSSER